MQGFLEKLKNYFHQVKNLNPFSDTPTWSTISKRDKNQTSKSIKNKTHKSLSNLETTMVS
jgi:hypothetical protein